MTIQSKNREKITSSDFDESKWRDLIDKEIKEDDLISYNTIASQPLLVNTKQFLINRGIDPLTELESDNYYELALDDRDLRHILIYLIYNHLNTKRFYELNPSIKELANLLYGIKNQQDFNRILNIMARTKRNIQFLMQQYPAQSTPNILPMYDGDKQSDLQYDGEGDKFEYDEYGQNVKQSQRDMTSFELDTTIKRIQDLEFRQYGYTQPVRNTYDETDDGYINVVQDDEEAEAEEIAKNLEVKEV